MKNKYYKQLFLILLTLPFLMQAQQVNNINDLFNALKKNPQTINDSLAVEKAIVGKSLAYSNLYPTLSAFGTYDNFSTATGLLPIAPNDLLSMVQDPTIPQPFSENIFRAGLSVSMPIFVKSIYSTAAKASFMHESAMAKEYLNLLQNEAIIVGSNANLQFLNALDEALESKKHSLIKTQELIALKVKNGRAPGSSLLIINNGINQVDVSKNEIALNREKTIATIQTLTGIRLINPVNMIEIGTIKKGELKSLEPLFQKLAADSLALRAEKEKLLPALSLRGNYNHSYAKAYNNDLTINEDYTAIGLALQIPLFNKTQYTHIKKSKLDYNSSKNDLDQLKLNLRSQANQLENSLIILDNSILLYEQNIRDKEEILMIAKASYESNRISIEDYLKYEDDLVLEKSKLYKTKASKWQTLMQLAVIYGNNIENLVR